MTDEQQPIADSETETFDTPTSNDVGEQTETKASIAAEDDNESDDDSDYTGGEA